VKLFNITRLLAFIPKKRIINHRWTINKSFSSVFPPTRGENEQGGYRWDQRDATLSS
jgi:hypothetical protein